MIRTQLEKVKKAFLADDVDEETRAENLEDITKWEEALVQGENLVSWQNHEVTRTIIKKATESYVDFSMKLVMDRTLTQAQRESLWAKQDACLWIISLADKDAKNSLKRIEGEIKAALERT